MWTGIALAATVPMFLLASPASAQDGHRGSGSGPAGNGGGAATAGPSGSGTVSVGGGSSGGSSSGGAGGSSTSFGSNTGSTVAGNGSAPSGVRGPITARDSATGGGGVVVGRAVHGADTSAYRSGDGSGRFSDHTAGRFIGLDSEGRTSDAGNVPAYSRPRDGATVSGTAVPRGSVPMQPGPGGGISYINNGNGYGYYGLNGYYGPAYASCDPFTSYSFLPASAYGGFSAACGHPYGYAGMMYDPWYASTMMGAFSADPWYGGSGGGSSSETWTPDSPADATLRLKIKPSQAEVFVDGFFVGVVNDFDGMFQKLHIESGAHRIEVRAPGYETLDLDIKLTAGKTTVYQGELTKIK
jgi:hypothetical protein